MILWCRRKLLTPSTGSFQGSGVLSRSGVCVTGWEVTARSHAGLGTTWCPITLDITGALLSLPSSAVSHPAFQRRLSPRLHLRGTADQSLHPTCICSFVHVSFQRLFAGTYNVLGPGPRQRRRHCHPLRLKERNHYDKVSPYVYEQAQHEHGEPWDTWQGHILLGGQTMIWDLGPLALAVHFSSRKVHEVRHQEIPYFWLKRVRPGVPQEVESKAGTRAVVSCPPRV